MGGLQGADNGDVTHYDDKKWEEDDAGYQDGERNRGRVGGGEEGACSWEKAQLSTSNIVAGFTWIFVPPSSSPNIGSYEKKNIIMWIQIGLHLILNNNSSKNFLGCSNQNV